ncbi:MAG TPA: cobyrinate a,c-diamide synthase, partial [Aliiroseovarius sp.]|nr:cobyrinate a,c-diamide synthase [Aliiroseovarius sp.]
LPVILVVDVAHMAQSVAALVAGFCGADPGGRVAGLILNKVGSPRHERMLRRALAPLGLPVLGAMYRQSGLAHPSRHLGLVQAREHPDLGAYLNAVADAVEAAVDLDALVGLAAELPGAGPFQRQTPPGQRIAIAGDAAFAFAYPHILDDWRAGGAEISVFSPLADETPKADADFIFLPGGYPELYAAQLANARRFSTALRTATCPIYGECGGFMVLGDGLTDKDGHRHAMLGLLRLETSFAKRKLHLGYRHLQALGGPFTGAWAAHEFHYATTLKADGAPLFKARDAEGQDLGAMGLVNGPVSGSFAHLLDPA